MIAGWVNAYYEAVIPIHLQDATGNIHEFEAILDTGFNGTLTLPSELIGSHVASTPMRACLSLSRISWDFRSARRILRVMPIFSGAGSTAEKCGHASQPHQCCVGVRAEPGGYVYGTVRRENRRDPDGRYLQERQRQQLAMASAGRNPDTWRLVSRRRL